MLQEKKEIKLKKVSFLFFHPFSSSAFPEGSQGQHFKIESLCLMVLYHFFLACIKFLSYSIPGPVCVMYIAMYWLYHSITFHDIGCSFIVFVFVLLFYFFLRCCVGSRRGMCSASRVTNFFQKDRCFCSRSSRELKNLVICFNFIRH